MSELKQVQRRELKQEGKRLDDNKLFKQSQNFLEQQKPAMQPSDGSGSPMPLPDSPGVLILRDVSRGAYLIATGLRLKERMSALQARMLQLEVAACLLCSTRDTSRIAPYLSRQFASKRRSDGWYTLSPGEISWARQYFKDEAQRCAQEMEEARQRAIRAQERAARVRDLAGDEWLGILRRVWLLAEVVRCWADQESRYCPAESSLLGERQEYRNLVVGSRALAHKFEVFLRLADEIQSALSALPGTEPRGGKTQ